MDNSIESIFLNTELNPERKVALPCSNCNSDCCGSIPLTKEFVYSMWVKYKLNSLLGKFKHAKYTKSRIPNTRNYFNKASMCIFQYNGKCLIYEDRPILCRVYGESYLVRCPYENRVEQPDDIFTKNALILKNDRLRDQLMLELSMKVL